jgi:MoxR-like ATPase
MRKWHVLKSWEVSPPRRSFSPRITYKYEGVIKIGNMKTDAWKLFADVAAAAPLVSRVLLYGKPGTGKTMNATKTATDRGFYSVTLTEESSVSELLGFWMPKGTEFFFSDGVAIKAWREGRLLVINEIDKASGSVQTLLHGILDDQEMAGMTLPTSETVRPAAGFRAIATMNGDVADLPIALADRFELKLKIDEPHPDALASLPTDLQKLAKNAYSTEGDDVGITFREIVAYSKLRQVVSPKDALVVFGDRSAQVGAALAIGTR